MFELIREHQLNIMLLLCGACGILVFLLAITRFMSKSRKKVLIYMEIVAFFLLFFDRLAYIYAGNTGQSGYIMVRVSNFMVFFLTSAIVFVFNRYLKDLIGAGNDTTTLPMRIKLVGSLSALGMALAIISAYTNMYYYFDDNNVYHRGSGFLIAYIVPIVCPILQYTIIRKYRKMFSKLIYISIVLYIFVPIICGILQIFTYGISIVNMSMVAVSISLYLFAYLDINNTVEHAHEIEIQNMQGEKVRMQRLFDQTATAFVSAVENKDDFVKGNAIRVAEYAEKIAKLSGKDEDYCEKVYYTALLHDVGMIGIPDSVIKNEADPDKWDYEAIRKKPIIGKEILSSITEYPYLSQGAQYSHERYNGTGYPEGLSGADIPEMARITAIADAYVTMTTKKRYRDARPYFVARERFVKGAGVEFDPEYAGIMVGIIDEENKGKNKDIDDVEKELSCGEFREHISGGIRIESNEKSIRFEFIPTPDADNGFSEPAIIIFDSFDRRNHRDEKTIKEYHYFEHGEIWFNDHMISSGARKIELVNITKKDNDGNSGNNSGENKAEYEIIAAKFEDHIRLEMNGPEYVKEIIIALPDRSTTTYIGLTGEHGMLKDITVKPTGKTVHLGDIPRIVDEISYIDHMESDVKNVQIDRTRSAYTEGIEIGNRLKLIFNTMSLPSADLIWHCPYVLLFYSDDGTVEGDNYREYSLTKLNGESTGTDEYAANRFRLKKKEEFPGWDAWKEACKKGMECEITLEKKGNRIILKTENLGINIECTTTINEEYEDKVYVALTGDQVALTDIRIQ